MRSPRVVSVSYNSGDRTLTAALTDGSLHIHAPVPPHAAINLSASQRKYGGFSLYPSFAKRYTYTTIKP
jgi:hypothetical protein